LTWVFGYFWLSCALASAGIQKLETRVAEESKAIEKTAAAYSDIAKTFRASDQKVIPNHSASSYPADSVFLYCFLVEPRTAVLNDMRADFLNTAMCVLLIALHVDLLRTI